MYQRDDLPKLKNIQQTDQRKVQNLRKKRHRVEEYTTRVCEYMSQIVFAKK